MPPVVRARRQVLPQRIPRRLTTFLIALGATSFVALATPVEDVTEEPYGVPVLILTCLLVAAWAAYQEGREQHQEPARPTHLRYSMREIDAQSPTTFEHTLRDLMQRDGINAHHTGGSNDHAADVLGHDRHHDYMLQAKHRTNTRTGYTSADVIYQVNGTAWPIHHADIAIVATNAWYSHPARQFARRVGIHLIDRNDLKHWAEDGHSLYEILQIAPPD